MGNRASKKSKKDKKEETTEGQPEQQGEDKKPECDQAASPEGGATDDCTGDKEGGGGESKAGAATESTNENDGSKSETVEIKVTDASGTTTVTGSAAEEEAKAAESKSSEEQKTDGDGAAASAETVEDKTPEAPVVQAESSSPVTEQPGEPAQPVPPEPLPVTNNSEAASGEEKPAQESMPEMPQESISEAAKEIVSEAVQEAVSEAAQETVQETVAETVTETAPEVLAEPVVESKNETAPVAEEPTSEPSPAPESTESSTPAELPPPPASVEQPVPQVNGINGVDHKDEEVTPADSVPTTNGDSSFSQTVEFKWEHGGEKVLVSGTFNDWKEQVPLEKQEDVFVGKLDLGVGEYQYKYIVDDEWVTNKNQKLVNGEDSENNVIVVVQPA